MKRKVIYVKACSPIVVGQQAVVIPLNHTSDLVTNGHECWTTPVVSIADDGTTFETKNSIYVLAAIPGDELEQDAQAVKQERLRAAMHRRFEQRQKVKAAA